MSMVPGLAVSGLLEPVDLRDNISPRLHRGWLGKAHMHEVGDVSILVLALVEVSDSTNPTKFEASASES